MGGLLLLSCLCYGRCIVECWLYGVVLGGGHRWCVWWWRLAVVGAG